MNTVEFAVDHHSAYPHDGHPQLDRVNMLHRNRGFPLSNLGYYVGYHFFIEENGKIIQTRELTETGAHSYNCGCQDVDISGVPAGMINVRSIGICLAGNFTKDTPKDQQIVALHSLIFLLHKQYGIRHLLHRETKRTSCPVVDLRAMVDKYHKEKFLPEMNQQISSALDRLKGYRLKRAQRIARRILQILSPQPV